MNAWGDFFEEADRALDTVILALIDGHRSI